MFFSCNSVIVAAHLKANGLCRNRTPKASNWDNQSLVFLSRSKSVVLDCIDGRWIGYIMLQTLCCGRGRERPPTISSGICRCRTCVPVHPTHDNRRHVIEKTDVLLIITDRLRRVAFSIFGAPQNSNQTFDHGGSNGCSRIGRSK